MFNLGETCMKKSLIALAVLAAAGAASAQSSVTIFGIVDATLQFGRGTVSDMTRLGSGGLSTSRIGFRGTEDLGGGMSASFWLEAQFFADTGLGDSTNSNNQTTGTSNATAGTQGLTFNRRSTVSLAGRWGEVRLGRDYIPPYENTIRFDPFSVIGVGGTLLHQIGSSNAVGGPVAQRSSNGVTYFLPRNLGGFYGSVQYHMGENSQNGAATENDGRGMGIRLGYAGGPVDVAIGTHRADYAAGDTRRTNLAGQWDFGVARAMFQIERARNGTLDGKGWMVGSRIPVGAGEIRAAYSVYETDLAGTPESKKLAIGYTHKLSKRTAVYTTYARLKNNAAARVALNGSSTGLGSSSSGLDIGLRHSF